MEQIEIKTPGDAAFALLAAHRAGKITLTTRAAQFTGQLVVGDGAMTEPQAKWLDQLLSKAGFDARFAGGE